MHVNIKSHPEPLAELYAILSLLLSRKVFGMKPDTHVTTTLVAYSYLHVKILPEAVKIKTFPNSLTALRTHLLISREI